MQRAVERGVVNAILKVIVLLALLPFVIMVLALLLGWLFGS